MTPEARSALLKSITERAASIHHCGNRQPCRTCENQLRLIVQDADALADSSTFADGYSAGGEQMRRDMEQAQAGWQPFNVNDVVRVKLNDHGRAIAKARTDSLSAFIVARGGQPFEHRSKPEDADGWSEWQAWELMQVFGEHVGMGMDMPFETTIEVKLPAPPQGPPPPESETNT